jgi:5-methylcytosine-specific restriction endonuclease McrA
MRTNGWEWGKVRTLVRRRDIGCIWQDETCEGRLEVDHILSRYEGGDDSLGNLRLLCRSHHVRRHNGMEPTRKASPLQVRQSMFQRRRVY